MAEGLQIPLGSSISSTNCSDILVKDKKCQTDSGVTYKVKKPSKFQSIYPLGSSFFEIFQS